MRPARLWRFGFAKLLKSLSDGPTRNTSGTGHQRNSSCTKCFSFGRRYQTAQPLVEMALEQLKSMQDPWLAAYHLWARVAQIPQDMV